MLRLAIRALALAYLLGAIGVTIWRPADWPMLIAPGLIAIGTFWERRYRGVPMEELAGAADFQPTGERFVDPETGRVTVVMTDSRTGARRYVEAPEG